MSLKWIEEATFYVLYDSDSVEPNKVILRKYDEGWCSLWDETTHSWQRIPRPKADNIEDVKAILLAEYRFQ